MKSLKVVLLMALGLAYGEACAAAFESVLEKTIVGDVRVTADEAGSWSFACARRSLGVGVDEIEVSLSSEAESPPPPFKVSWTIPQCDMQAFWTPQDDASYPISPDWGGTKSSDFAHWSPIGVIVNDRNRSRLVFAADEAHRVVRYAAGLNEGACAMRCWMSFLSGVEAPLKSYAVRIRLDRRDVFWSDAIREAAEWISSRPGNEPCAAPAAAFKPLYSTWYGFHQNVFAREIEEECAIAARLGMKTLILDDGWQSDGIHQGYSFCGDWQISSRRFPDMAAHVRRVQEMGIRYMVWFSVPFVGTKSANYARFKGKYLYECLGAGVLDPRFPECRAFLVGTYEKALRDWNIDGFKLDFIDNFRISGTDPAVAENYAGRDTKSVEEASGRLMGEVMARLKAIKPDLLVEFRQAYVGPAILKYGNMLRVADCPGDKNRNRRGIARLRLTSGKGAVHGDMLEWHPDEPAEVAARAILDSIFGVVQYSMVLCRLPERHVEMVRHWIDFSTRHEEALLHGKFRAYNPEHGYPVLAGESADERVLGVYLSGFSVDCGDADRTTYVLNGTGADRILLRLRATPRTVQAFDTFGRAAKAPELAAGVCEVEVPRAGYLRISY